VKVRSINFGYSFTPHLLAKAKITSLRVYVSAENPFFIYAPLVKDKLVLDPEGNGYSAGGQGANGSAQGVVGSTAGGTPVPLRAITVGLNTPPTRQFIFGINLKF
jgi:TonB-dependent starch-binding outer membrane protein SusC